jgi:putative lipoic acid-binding regulatory protein
MPTSFRAGLVVLSIMVVALSLLACGGGQEPDYAGPMAENILSAINQDSYAQYSESFTAEMRDKMPEDVVRQINSVIRLEIGTYESKEFWKTESAGQYTTVYYKARFTNEPDDVIVKVVFRKVQSKIYVAGFWLDSPKLAGG